MNEGEKIEEVLTDEEKLALEMGEALQGRVNMLLHIALDSTECCQNGCTHFVSTGMSALGISNIVKRAQLREWGIR